DRTVTGVQTCALPICFRFISRDTINHARRDDCESLALSCVCALVYEDETPALHVRRAEVQIVERRVAVVSFANVVGVERVAVRMRRRPLTEVARARHRAGASLRDRARNLP